MRRGPAVFLLFFLLFGAAYGAWRVGQEGSDRLAHFAPPPVEARPATGATPLANRLLLITIDDLRLEEVQQLPSLYWLRQKGAVYLLSAPTPGGSRAATASLLTGAPATIHGEMGVGADHPLRADNLLQAALRAGLKVGGAGSAELAALSGGALESWYETTSLTELAPNLSSLLQPNAPRLLLIQADDLRTAGAADGKGDGQAGEGKVEEGQDTLRTALSELNAQLTALFDQIEWAQTAVLVVGLAPADGAGGKVPLLMTNGGKIPLLMAGSGVQPGARGDGSLLDVAPTASALLGVATPMEAQGKPLLSGLTVQGRPADAVMERYLISRQAYGSAVLQSLGSSVTLDAPPTTVDESEGYLTQLSSQLRAARLAWMKDGLLKRLPYLGGGALLLLLYLLVIYRKLGRPALISHLLYACLLPALLFLLGGSYRTALAGLDSPLTVLRRFGPAVGASLLVTAVVGGLLLSRRVFRRTRYLAAAALHLLLSLAVAAALPMGITVLLTGWEFPAELPAPALWLWFFLTVLQVMLIGGLSPIWAWVAVRTARYAQHQWPLKEVGDPEVNADKVVRLKAIRRSKRQGVTR